MKTEVISPQTLVAIIVAARCHKNRELERDMRRTLEAEHGVKLRFLRNRHPEQRKGVRHV